MFLLVFLLAGSSLAEETPKALVTIRLKAAPSVALQLWILSFSEDGIRTRKLAGDRVRRIGWDEIIDGDRSQLRHRFRLELTEKEKKGLVDGVRLHFKNGAATEGVLERVDTEGRHWLRRGGDMLPYPKDRIREVEPMLLDETDVYGAEEIYRRVMERRRPKTAEGHLDVATRLARVSDFKRAAHHYREAIRMKPSLRWRLKPKLDSCEAIAKDAALAKVVRRSRKLSRLDHRYDDARSLLEGHLNEGAGRSRLVLKALDELDRIEAKQLNREFHERKNVELRRLIETFLRTKKLTLSQVRSYIDTGLERDLLAKLKSELELTDEQVEQFRERGSSGSAHWATFHHGSFIFDPFAKRGRGEGPKGDPDAWWTQYSDVATRSAFLRAYAAERLDELFETVRIRYKPCIGCGGKGAVRNSSIRSVSGGRHEWHETCDRCFGCGRDRVVAYR